MRVWKIQICLANVRARIVALGLRHVWPLTLAGECFWLMSLYWVRRCWQGFASRSSGFELYCSVAVRGCNHGSLRVVRCDPGPSCSRFASRSIRFWVVPAAICCLFRVGPTLIRSFASCTGCDPVVSLFEVCLTLIRSLRSCAGVLVRGWPHTLIRSLILTADISLAVRGWPHSHQEFTSCTGCDPVRFCCSGYCRIRSFVGCLPSRVAVRVSPHAHQFVYRRVGSRLASTAPHENTRELAYRHSSAARDADDGLRTNFLSIRLLRIGLETDNWEKAHRSGRVILTYPARRRISWVENVDRQGYYLNLGSF
jgi:hypothetical protein